MSMTAKYVKLLGIAMVSLALGGCSSLFSMSTDNTPKPTPLTHFTPSVQVNTLWAANLGSGFSQHNIVLNIAHEGQSLFVADTKGRLFALNSAGHVLWSGNTGLHITGGPGAGDGLVAVGGDDGQVAVYHDTGKLAWAGQIGNQILSSPVIADGVMVVKSIDGHVSAFDAATGKQKWVYANPTSSLILRGDSAPAIKDGLVVIGFSDGKVFAFNANTGQLQWQHVVSMPTGSTPLQQLVDIDGAPVISNGVVYVVNYQGNVVALSLRNGQALWEHKLSSYTGLAVDANLVYASDSDGNVLAFDKETGAPQWRQTKLKARILTIPVVMGDYVVVADGQGYVHWLDKRTGRFAARVQNADVRIESAPRLIGKTLYVLDVSGRLTAYRLQPVGT